MEGFTKKTITTNNGEVLLTYLSRNYKKNINLIFLHGWACDKTIWESLVKSLELENFNVYILDLPGFGESILKNFNFRLYDYALCYLDFINKLKLYNNILIGHSLGGRIAYKLAEISESERTSRYTHYAYKQILIAPHGIKESDSFINSIIKIISKAVKPIFRFRSTASLRRKIYNSFGWSDYINSGEMKKVFINITDEDLRHVFPMVKIPTILIFGLRDKVSKLKYGKEMESKIRSSKLYVLESAGHFTFLDDLDQTKDIINKELVI